MEALGGDDALLNNGGTDQLFNLLVGRDLMREEGLDPDEWLANPQFSEAISRVVARLLKAADKLYTQAEIGISDLPWDCRPAIAAARLIYAEIGREVERLNLDSVSVRAVVSKQRKLDLGARLAVHHDDRTPLRHGHLHVGRHDERSPRRQRPSGARTPPQASRTCCSWA